MRTSLNNTKIIDDYLLDHMDPGDAVLFQAQMLLSTALTENVLIQQQTYAVIKQYSRKKIKAEIIAVQAQLATEPQHRSFMQSISNLFKK
jgi:hypothetical protein